MSEHNLLEIKDLHVSIKTEKGVVHAVNGVDLVIPRGKIVGLVGESGCGKSMTAKSVMALIPHPGKVEGGSILLNGRELTGLSEKEMEKVRGDEVSMIFQEPMTSLNPVLKAGHQVKEALQVHGQAESSADAKRQIIQLFKRIGIPEAEKRYSSYPHELSGGLRQRVMIAMAMACRPKLLIADEPTTALDVTIEAQILKLMQDLCLENDMGILLITHNLRLVAEICDYVYVMYAGRILEAAPVYELFDHTKHPYTKGLLSSIPRIGQDQEYLHTIPGSVPNLLRLSNGCAFANRCAYARDQCREDVPELLPAGENHYCRCF